MEREIKFRAWNKVSKKMMLWEDINRFGNLNKLISLDHVIVMQFTGLKDKNGKEIYEGDVIKIHYGAKINTDQLWICEFRDGAFGLGDNGYPGFTSFILYTDQLMTNKVIDYRPNLSEALEIMGSIHQNPELLTLANV